jgi:hypothetical protein
MTDRRQWTNIDGQKGPDGRNRMSDQMGTVV